MMDVVTSTPNNNILVSLDDGENVKRIVEAIESGDGVQFSIVEDVEGNPVKVELLRA